MNWYLAVLKKYAVFNGRARRKEYWMFALFNLLITIALSFAGGLIGSDGSILISLYGLAVFLPSLGVSVRRLHDIGRSGWWLLISLVPIVGFFVLLFFQVQDSQPGDNAYGPNPKSDRI